MSKYIDSEKLIAEIEKWSDGKLTLSLLTEIKEIICSLQQENEIIEFSFKGGTYKVNGEEKSFKGGKAKVIVLEIKQEEENK